MTLGFLLPLFLFVTLAAGTGSSFAVEPEGGAGDRSADRELPMAAIEIDGRELFRVRGVSALPAEKRAEIVKEAILAIARDPEFRPDSLRVVETEFATQIMAGDRRVMTVFDADGHLEQVRRQTLAIANLARIRAAIENYRRDRLPEAKRTAAWKTLTATFAVIAGLWLLIRLHRATDEWMEQRLQGHVQALGIQSFEIVRAERMWGALRGSLHGGVWLIMIVLVVLYLHYTLALFPWTRRAGNTLLALLVGPLETLSKELINDLPDLAFLAILFALIRYALKLLRFFVDAVAHGAVALSGFQPEWAIPTYKILRVVIVAFALVVAYPYIPGSESAAFKGVSIFLGVMFSVGASSILANVLAGYSLIYRRAFKLGDRVKIGDTVGDVIEMRPQVTHLRSPKNEEIIVPNSLILGNTVVNYSSLARRHGLILHTTVGIGYEVPWRQVEAMLLMAAERTGGLRQELSPFVLQRSLGDFAVNYELNAYCDDASRMYSIYSDLHRNILDVFNEYGVQIMTPVYERDPEQPKIVPREQWHAAPAPPGSPKHPSEQAFRP